MARYAYHQVDTNQQAIIDALEAGGCTVSRIGRPVDLAVGKAGKTYLFEVKRPKGELRESQVRFIAGWREQHLNLKKLTQKYWVRYFSDYILEKIYPSQMED